MGREFLVNAPLFVEQRQRISYESIALATQIIEINFADLVELSQRCFHRNPQAPEFDSMDRARLFSLAWSIVDQVDLLRQLVHFERRNIDLVSARAFMEAATVANTLRNWMDHLPGRISAYIEKKKKMPPAHGALSFTFVSPDLVSRDGGPVPVADVPEYRAVVVLSTSMHRALQVEGEPIRYNEFEVPFDHFVLQAFGEHLSLSKIVALASAFCDDLGARVELFCLSKADEIAAATGQALDGILKRSELPAGTLVMTARRNA